MMIFLTAALLCMLALTYWQEVQGAWTPAHISSLQGHYPGAWCKITNVMLSSSSEAFLYQPGNQNPNITCLYSTQVWPIKANLTLHEQQCSKEYDEGFAFTVYYHSRGSNYFHLHYDVTIPMYYALYYNQKTDDLQPTRVLMPTVESSRMQMLDWKTSGFQQPSKYWMQLIKLLATDEMAFLPLDEDFLKSSSNVCFKTVYFGTPSVDYGNSDVIRGFAGFMKSRLHVLERPLTVDNLRVGLISRSNRRRILNEPALLEAVRPDVEIDLIRFEGLTIREQVSLVQRYAVIVGVNGAGLMNAIFRPLHAVAVQLVPYKASVNHIEFGNVLQSVGSYFVWHNTHEHLHRQMNSDPHNNRADTIVDVEEFKQLILKALDMVRDNILGIKEEL